MSNQISMADKILILSIKADKILNLYTKYGQTDYIGENITQIDHALQCAECAEKDMRLYEYDGYIRNCMIVAALLHDIGHLVGLETDELKMENENKECLGIVGHEGIGSNYLKECGMPFLVYELVKSHVQAKRYLASTNKSYYDKLSNASKQTMTLQGGFMTLDEIKAFNSSILPELKIILREYDDTGKTIPTTITHNINKYKTHLELALLCNKKE